MTLLDLLSEFQYNIRKIDGFNGSEVLQIWIEPTGEQEGIYRCNLKDAEVKSVYPGELGVHITVAATRLEGGAYEPIERKGGVCSAGREYQKGP